MKFNVLAIAAALFSMTAAAVQASPATVIPDTAHAIVKDTKTVVGGTYEGVSDQVKHDARAGRRVTRYVSRNVRHAYSPRRHRVVRRTTRTTSTPAG